MSQFVDTRTILVLVTASMRIGRVRAQKAKSLMFGLCWRWQSALSLCDHWTPTRSRRTKSLKGNLRLKGRCQHGQVTQLAWARMLFKVSTEVLHGRQWGHAFVSTGSQSDRSCVTPIHSGSWPSGKRIATDGFYAHLKRMRRRRLLARSVNPFLISSSSRETGFVDRC